MVDARTAKFFPGGDAVVDLGCGDGSWLDAIAHRYQLALGIDVSPERVASRTCTPSGWTFLQADLGKGIPLDSGSIDAVHANQVIEHIPNPLTFAVEARRVLRPGGVFVATTPNIRYAKHLARLVLQGNGPLTSARGDARTLRDWDGGHIHYFTPRDLEWIVEHAGFASWNTSALIATDGSLLRRLLDRWSASAPVTSFLSGNTLLVAWA